MPLQRADDAYDPSDSFSAILFQMTDGTSRIVYRVTYPALQDRASADGEGARFDAVETFLKHRPRIKQIASEKYDAGDAERVVTTAELTPAISVSPNTPVAGTAPQDVSFLSGAVGLDIDADLIKARRRRSAPAIEPGATEVPTPLPAAAATSVVAGSGSIRIDAAPPTVFLGVPDQTLAPIRVEERDGKIARASDRDSALRSTEADFNAWREPIIEHVRELLEGDFQQGTNHSRARDRLVALETLLSGNLSEVKDRQFHIGYEIERLGGLISAYRSSGDDMPAMNAAVLEDLERLYLALKIGIDKLERWVEFHRMAADDPLHEGDANPAVVGEALDGMAAEMERQPKYFDPQLPASFRFLAEAVRDPVGATKTTVYGAVKSVENLISFLAQKALGIARKAADAVEERIPKAVARVLIISLGAGALHISGALPTAWAWLKPLLAALSGGG